MHKRMILAGFVLFGLISVCMIWGWKSSSPAEVISSDAISYNTLAVNILQHHFYSVDGVHPYFEREPGYSVFLAIIYQIFGVGNYWAVFIVQAIAYCLASLLFAIQAQRFVGRTAASLFFVLACGAVSIYHSIFSLYREGWALILLLAFSALYLSYQYRGSLWKAVILGLLFAWLVMTYFSFTPFILVLLVFFIIRKMPLVHIASVVTIPILFVSFLSLRAHYYANTWSPVASVRTAIMIGVRGEQAVNVRGVEPFMCQWAEYVSRDWSKRSPSCSFNAVMHRLADIETVDTKTSQAIADLGKKRIEQNFLHYLWFSVFEVMELHLPFLGGGWSKIYNLSAALTSFILYCGIPFSWKYWKKPTLLLFIILPLYNTAFFALTDATPRYLNPVIFCYVLFSAIGYAALIKRFTRVS